MGRGMYLPFRSDYRRNGTFAKKPTTMLKLITLAAAGFFLYRMYINNSQKNNTGQSGKSDSQQKNNDEYIDFEEVEE